MRYSQVSGNTWFRTMAQRDDLYAFAYRGLLARQAVSDLHQPTNSHIKADKIASRLPFQLMDEALVSAAKEMAVVYTAIGAFENSAREFIEKRLLEEVGSNWWEQCVPEKRRQKAESRRDEENKIRWHAKEL